LIKKGKKMMKVNIGLIGILVIILLILFSISNLNSRNDNLTEELTIIKSLLQDIDSDIHEIEEKFEK
tara:strand:+ start:390 stop:590 length:201 start_codon:yes stop_codon:yes gene_type:complete